MKSSTRKSAKSSAAKKAVAKKAVAKKAVAPGIFDLDTTIGFETAPINIPSMTASISPRAKKVGVAVTLVAIGFGLAKMG